MDQNQQNMVREAAENGLNEAIVTWSKVGHALMDSVSLEHKMEAVAGNESNIPGHPLVKSGQPEVTEFVALVVDMRNSSDRLQNLQTFPGIESGFQRVYYETSALLPAIATTALMHSGHVTEYLGDGVLILFKVDTDDRAETVRKAYRAANYCVTLTRDIVNALLNERFDLPLLSIGAGMSMSNAIVTMVGISQYMQPKAIGQCVWEASKLSSGFNTVHVSDRLQKAWPTGKSGQLQFKRLEGLPKKLVGFSVLKG